MELAGDALPGDLEALRALALRLQQELVETGKVAADLEAERDALTCERDALALDNERLGFRTYAEYDGRAVAGDGSRGDARP